MVLSDLQIKEYILNPKNKDIIDFQVKLKSDHELHLTGLGIDEFIDTVDGIENKSYLEVKKKLKNTITVKSFEKVLRPKDKILTAKGGTTILEFDDDSKKTILESALSDLNYKGHSLDSYTETIWLDYGIWIDPMGITMVEYVMEPLEIGFKKTNQLRLDYISIYEYIKGKKFINYHDFEYTSFDRIEYLILNEGSIKIGEEIYKVYRVIDDEKDEIWLQQEEDKTKIELREDSTFFHGFGKVPAVFNSNRVDKKSINRWFTTYCAESLIVAKDYLNDYIDYRLYKKKLGIPRFWEFKTKCTNCDASGNVENPTDSEGKYYGGSRWRVCPACNGKKYNQERSLTDVTYLEILSGESQTNVPPSGAVTLPTDIQEQLRKELDEMEFDLAEVVWGQGSAVDKERKDTTAFEISVRNESKIDKLRAIEKNKVDWQKSIIDMIGFAMFEGKYKGAIITPATQFLMLTPTEARQVYLESKKAKSSEPQLTKLWIDYLTSEYENDPMTLKREIIIMLLTPMFHTDIIEAWDYLTPEEKEIKKNLQSYLIRYENEQGSILIADQDKNKLQEIKDKLNEYATEDINKKTDKNDTSIQQDTGQQDDLQ